MKKRAFTLAETLITLMVIGVVAALTIPSLMRSYRDRQTVTAVLKAANTLTNAYKLSIADDGDVTDWFKTDGSNGIKKLYSHMKAGKVCPAGDNHDKTCFHQGNMVTLDGYEYWKTYDDFPAAMLLDGSTVAYFHHDDKCEDGNALGKDGAGIYCGRIFYDINGLKEPNQYGIDIFTFALTKNGVKPDSRDSDTQFENFYEEMCNPQIQNVYNGTACTKHVLINRNVDYLHK